MVAVTDLCRMVVQIDCISGTLATSCSNRTTSLPHLEHTANRSCHNLETNEASLRCKPLRAIASVNAMRRTVYAILQVSFNRLGAEAPLCTYVRSMCDCLCAAVREWHVSSARKVPCATLLRVLEQRKQACTPFSTALTSIFSAAMVGHEPEKAVERHLHQHRMPVEPLVVPLEDSQQLFQQPYILLLQVTAAYCFHQGFAYSLDAAHMRPHL